jgi:hypothetical protein
MEKRYVFRTLQAKGIASAAAAIFTAAMAAQALANTLVTSQTIKSGTKIACVLDEHIDSSQLSYGDTFKLRVVDTSIPALHGSEIIGYITDVKKPSGGEQGRVGFFLTNIKLPNGEKKSITAYVVSRRVTNYNPAAQYAQRQQLSPMAGVPVGTVTAGPVAWQMRLGNGPSTVQTHKSPSLGGYVYTSKWPIVVEAGTSVTVELSENLTIP